MKCHSTLVPSMVAASLTLLFAICHAERPLYNLPALILDIDDFIVAIDPSVSTREPTTTRQHTTSHSIPRSTSQHTTRCASIASRSPQRAAKSTSKTAAPLTTSHSRRSVLLRTSATTHSTLANGTNSLSSPSKMTTDPSVMTSDPVIESTATTTTTTSQTEPPQSPSPTAVATTDTEVATTDTAVGTTTTTTTTTTAITTTESTDAPATSPTKTLPVTPPSLHPTTVPVVSPTGTRPAVSIPSANGGQTRTSGSGGLVPTTTESPVYPAMVSNGSSNKMAITIGVVIGAILVMAAISVFVFRKWKLSPSRQFKSKIRNTMRGSFIAGTTPSHDNDTDSYDAYNDMFRPAAHEGVLPATGAFLIGSSTMAGAGLSASMAANGASSPPMQQQYQHRLYPYDSPVYEHLPLPQQQQAVHLTSSTVPDYGQYRYAQGGNGQYEPGTSETMLGRTRTARTRKGGGGSGHSDHFLRELRE